MRKGCVVLPWISPARLVVVAHGSRARVHIGLVALVVDLLGLDRERELMRAATSMLSADFSSHDRSDRALHLTRRLRLDLQGEVELDRGDLQLQVRVRRELRVARFVAQIGECSREGEVRHHPTLPTLARLHVPRIDHITQTSSPESARAKHTNPAAAQANNDRGRAPPSTTEHPELREAAELPYNRMSPKRNKERSST